MDEEKYKECKMINKTEMNSQYSPEDIIRITAESIGDTLRNLELLNIGESKATLRIAYEQLVEALDNIEKTKRMER